MIRNLYFRLAKKNIDTGTQTYIPYIFACSLSVMMFSIIYTISKEAFVQSFLGVKTLMEFGAIITAFFSMIFIFYGNKFLIKNRMKEIGLYTILGLEKKHIAGALFFEFFICYIVTLLLGSADSLLFGKLCFLILYKVSGISAKIQYVFSFSFFKAASIVFFCFFSVNYVYNLKKISLLNPIQFLTENRSGEKRGKYSVIKTLLAALFLGAGYTLSFLSSDTVSAVKLFLPAVLFVIAGTFFLFESLVVFILTQMKKRSSYYKPTRFISVSRMIYRVGQHAKGLASICILLTMILLIIASVASIYQGSEKIASKAFIKNHIFQVLKQTDGEIKNKDTIIKNIQDISAKNGVEIDDVFYLRYFYGDFNIQNNSFYKTASFFSAPVIRLIVTDTGNVKGLLSQDISDADLNLDDDELLVYCSRNSFDSSKHVTIGAKQFKFKKPSTQFIKIIKDSPYVPYTAQLYSIIICKDTKTLADIETGLNLLHENVQDGRLTKQKPLMLEQAFFWNTSADASKKTPSAYSKALKAFAASSEESLSYDNKFQAIKSRREFDGSFLFLGIFLSITFLMWLILIMYFKQISEGLEDRKRWQIMLKLGTDYSLIKKTSRSQLILLFVLPVFVSLIHSLFASPIFTDLLLAFGLFNKTVFFATLLMSSAFTLIFYLFFYKMTLNKYNKIIRLW